MNEILSLVAKWVGPEEIMLGKIYQMLHVLIPV